MKNFTIGYLMLASAIIWGAVIVGCSLKLKGTSCYDEIKTILYGGVIIHQFLFWIASVRLLKKKESKE